MLGANLAEAARLEPEGLSITLPLRDAATASMTLTHDGPDVPMHAWFELFTARGSVGLFRVTDATRTTRRETSYTLRHGIDTLSDDVWPEQTDYDGTVAGFLAALLAKQTSARWQLGTCEDTAAWKRAGINYTRLSDLLNEVTAAREGYYLAYDFTTTPWTVSFLALPQTVSAEFRLARNVTSASVNRNDGDMCNRLYLSVNAIVGGKNTVQIKTYNDATSQALYGVIAKTADIDTADVADPDAWAADFLARRAEPAVQITIDGLELAARTGESWDETDRGRLVRAVFGELGETATERVESVTYPDALGEPERVTVELANRLDAFAETIARLERAAGRGAAAARAGARTAEEQKYWAMVVRDTDLENLYLTGIELDAQSGATIYNLAQGFVSQYAGIKVNRQQIGLVVEESAGGYVIKAASIVAAINDAGSSVTIDADKIYLNGQTSISSLLTGAAVATSLKATNLQANDAFNFRGHNATWRQFTFVDDSGTPITATFMIQQNVARNLKSEETR